MTLTTSPHSHAPRQPRRILRAARTLFGCLFTALTSCQEKAPPGHNATPLPAVSVKTVQVVAGEYPAVEEVMGTVRPRLRSRIEAKLSGRIEQMLAVPGEAVKQGDLLVLLSVQEVQAQVDQARAVLDQAERDVQRFVTLVQQKAVSQQEYEAAESRRRVAVAGLAAAETMMGYARITAPFDGVVTRKHADVGDLAMPGKPLAELEAPGTLRFEADVPEASIGHIKAGAVLAVRISSFPKSIAATISEIAPVADAVSRTYLVKLDLPAMESLRAGQFGRLAVPVGISRVLRVPDSAVVQRGQMEMLFVVESATARLRLVRTGKRPDGQVEILSGLTAGETVITEGVSSLKDGTPVK